MSTNKLACIRQFRANIAYVCGFMHHEQLGLLVKGQWRLGVPAKLLTGKTTFYHIITKCLDINLVMITLRACQGKSRQIYDNYKSWITAFWCTMMLISGHYSTVTQMVSDKKCLVFSIQAYNVNNLKKHKPTPSQYKEVADSSWLRLGHRDV